jgi:hypothetical protein
MALGSTQPQTEMSTRNLIRGKERPVRKADSLIAICKPIFPLRLTTLQASMACYRNRFAIFTLPLPFVNNSGHTASIPGDAHLL